MAASYEVTATRKRPQDFDRLVGQEFVVSTLENAISENRIAHAYLFSGPRGVGKTSSARLLAKALNCEKGPTAHPCGTCDSCRAIAQGKAVDVIEIDTADDDFAGVGLFFFGDHFDESGFASAGFADEKDELVRFNVEGDVVKRGFFVAGVDFGDMIQQYHGFMIAQARTEGKVWG